MDFQGFLDSPMPKTNGKPNRLSYFISHWFSFILIFVICIIIYLGMETYSFGPFTSRDLANIDAVNDQVEPFYFIHLTDTHVCEKPLNVGHDIEIFQAIDKTLDPCLVVLSGDITDGSETTFIGEFRHQAEINWIKFKNISDQYLAQNDRIIFPIAGNHDFYSLYDDSKSFYRQYILQNDSDYRTRKLQYLNTPVGNISFLGFVSMPIPYTNAPFGTILHLQKEYFEYLDSQYDEDIPTILFMHFPPQSIIASKEVKKKVLEKAELILDGHYHPRTPEITFIGKTISIMSPATYESDIVPLITYERGAIVYNEMHPLNKNNKNNVIEIAISYPVPEDQISSYTVFNIDTFSIRIMVFASEEVLKSQNLENLQNLEIEAEIDGENFGKFLFRKNVRKTGAFYSLPVKSLSKGKHTLKVFGTSSKIKIQTRLKLNFPRKSCRAATPTWQ